MFETADMYEICVGKERYDGRDEDKIIGYRDWLKESKELWHKFDWC